MQWAVVAVAVPVLIWAANTAMLGVSRHVYVLATNRQIPSWAGRLERTHATPYVAIAIAAVMAVALAIPADIEFLAGVYAFGALLAATIAHLSIVRLRFTDPDRERPFSVPGNVTRRRPAGAAAGGRRGHRQRAAVGQRDRVPRRRADGRRRVDGVRAALLRLLPQGRGGGLADRAGSRSPSWR